MGILKLFQKFQNCSILIHKTYNSIILNIDPNLIISVDSPGFVFRVLQKVKKKKI